MVVLADAISGGTAAHDTVGNSRSKFLWQAWRVFRRPNCGVSGDAARAKPGPFGVPHTTVMIGNDRTRDGLRPLPALRTMSIREGPRDGLGM